QGARPIADGVAVPLRVVAHCVASPVDLLPNASVNPGELGGSGFSVAEPGAEGVRRNGKVGLGEVERSRDADGELLPAVSVLEVQPFGEHFAGGHPVFADLGAGAYGVLLPDPCRESSQGAPGWPHANVTLRARGLLDLLRDVAAFGDRAVF